jgi:hypothetical protein
MIQPLALGRCQVALTHLYGNLHDRRDAGPGENWTRLRRLVANEPSIRACASRLARPHGRTAARPHGRRAPDVHGYRDGASEVARTAPTMRSTGYPDSCPLATPRQVRRSALGCGRSEQGDCLECAFVNGRPTADATSRDGASRVRRVAGIGGAALSEAGAVDSDARFCARRCGACAGAAPRVSLTA